MELAPAERVVILVDFSGLADGDEQQVVNDQQAQDTLLQQVASAGNGTLDDFSYDTVSFNFVLQAWVKQHSTKAAPGAADALLLQFLQLQQKHPHLQR